MIKKYYENESSNNVKDLMLIKEQKILVYKVAAIVLGIICIMLIVALTIVASYPKSQGYVIELTPDGAARYNPDSVTALEDWKPKDNTINYFLRNFIIELRSVSSDPQIIQSNIDKLYRQVTGKAADQVTAYLRETNPKKRMSTETVTIKVASILPISDTSYQIDFRETVWTSSKKVKSDTHYRCIVHTEIYIPTTTEQIAYNPIGLYVTDFNISLVKEI